MNVLLPIEAEKSVCFYIGPLSDLNTHLADKGFTHFINFSLQIEVENIHKKYYKSSVRLYPLPSPLQVYI